MTGMIVGLGCFILHVVATLVWLRRPGRPSPVARHAVSALGTHLFGVFLAAWLAPPFSYWSAAAVSGFGAIVWLFVFSAVYKSVSLRILRELARSQGRTLALAAITDQYVLPEFESRVAVLLQMRCVRATANGYEVTRKGTDIASRIAVFQWLFGITASGLYADPADREHPRAEDSAPVADAPRSPVINSPTP
jgi:hypothetical protein